MLNDFEQYATKNLMITTYLSTNNWIAVAIIPKQRKVYCLDSLRQLILILTLSSESLMSKLFSSEPADVPQQTVQSILINSGLTIVACFVVGFGNVTAAKRSSCA
jgi:hypothetical protein